MKEVIDGLKLISDSAIGKSLLGYYSSRGFLTPKQVNLGIKILHENRLLMPDNICVALEDYWNGKKNYLREIESMDLEMERAEAKEREEKERIAREAREREEKEREERERIAREAEAKERLAKQEQEIKEVLLLAERPFYAWAFRFIGKAHERNGRTYVNSDFADARIWDDRIKFVQTGEKASLERCNKCLRTNLGIFDFQDAVQKKINDFYNQYRPVFYDDKISDLKDTGTLEALSQATETLLTRTGKIEGEYLEISLDKDGTRFVIEPKRLDYDYHRPSYGAMDSIKKIPELFQPQAWIEKYPYRYMVGATDFSCLVIRNEWNGAIHFKKATYKFKAKVKLGEGENESEEEVETEIVRESREAQMLYEIQILRFMSLTKLSYQIANFKVNNTMPELPATFADHPDESLKAKPFQKAGFVFSYKREGFAYFMDQGTGKTLCVILRICTEAREKYLKEKRMYRVLIVGPKQCRLNWQEEIKRFSTVSGKCSILRGDLTRRMEAVCDGIKKEETPCYFSAVICGYQSVGNTWDALSLINWDLIVIDESHHIKSPSTDRWKDMSQLRDKGKSRLILTGTPMNNVPWDLWTQLEFLGKGLSGFASFAGFKRFYGKFTNKGGYEALLELKNMPLLQERLSRISFRVTKKEANLQLPEKLYKVLEIGMTTIQAKLYQDLAQKLYAEIESELAMISGVPNCVTINNILTKILRLSHVTSGFITTDEIVDPATGFTIKPKEVKNISGENPKLNTMIEYIKEEMDLKLEKVIIWACWVRDIENISKRLELEGIKHVKFYGATTENDRTDAVKTFNCDPEVKVFIGNQSSCGEGLTLIGYDRTKPDIYETNTTTVFIYSQDFSMPKRKQLEDRAHRLGTRCPIEYVNLTVIGTIDEDIRKRVQGKIEVADNLQSFQELFKNLLRKDYDNE